MAVVLTYARVPVEELYHTDESGLAGGFGRALVALNFPIALVATALAAFAAVRLGGRGPAVLALVAAALCWVTAIPGVVDEDDLDAKAVNAVPALGVALALALTIAAGVRHGVGRPEPRLPGDPVRLALGVLLVAVGLPWLIAELGVYIGDLPGLGHLYLSDELRPTPENPDHRVVHLGQHHGGHGVYLALSALALTRVLPQLGRRRLRTALTFYLSLMLVYGVALVAEDAWGEQVVARDWTSWTIPSVLEPALSPEWVVLLAAAFVLAAAIMRGPSSWSTSRRAASRSPR